MLWIATRKNKKLWSSDKIVSDRQNNDLGTPGNVKIWELNSVVQRHGCKGEHDVTGGVNLKSFASK